MKEAYVIVAAVIFGLGLGVAGTWALSGNRGKLWMWETMRRLKVLMRVREAQGADSKVMEAA